MITAALETQRIAFEASMETQRIAFEASLETQQITFNAVSKLLFTMYLVNFSQSGPSLRPSWRSTTQHRSVVLA
jgi:hypothetical protein